MDTMTETPAALIDQGGQIIPADSIRSRLSQETQRQIDLRFATAYTTDTPLKEEQHARCDT